MCGLQKPICVILLVTNRRHRLLDEEDEDASVDHPKNSRSYGNSRITWNIRSPSSSIIHLHRGRNWEKAGYPWDGTGPEPSLLGVRRPLVALILPGRFVANTGMTSRGIHPMGVFSHHRWPEDAPRLPAGSTADTRNQTPQGNPCTRDILQTLTPTRLRLTPHIPPRRTHISTRPAQG
ncbi:hypothetical protein PGT21_021263 [Puccinia graminis f. sp. tritici]|uniref:Uncharacterized protein n=1 Tax=Puccinia graminis f. sp. tritici TaxID=56615 RepID=A0A5B0P445_PUCGR|nr:hypothetical protein PGTUg99_032812 [Puccinia graminis f. sp. tritici]KAA1099806.1 hypothetical protein PGT21_021263 [Puccinia graminis f. sp. tritici]